jgi:hypothetical protein
MADEERGKELPQRVRGATRAAPPASVSSPSALSDELRQRIQAAVDAERSDLAVPKQEPPKQEPPKGINGKHGQAAKPEPATKAKTRLFFEEDDEVTALHPVTPRQLAEASPADAKQTAPAQTGRPTSPPPGAAKKPNRRSAGRRLGTWLVFAVLAGLAAGVLAVVAVRHFGSPAAKQPTAAQLRAETAAGTATATWLTQHVSQDAAVACDRVMCAALTARGFPARKLLVLGPASGDPFRTAAVVVETPAVLGLFGSSLATAWAPDVLASFGSGPARITIRVVAPHGAAAYRALQSLDLGARKTAGAALLNDSQIFVPALAGEQLTAGQVDSRVLLALADLAGQQPVRIVQFGDDGPGASADLPLRFVDLAENVPAAHQAPAAYVKSVRAYLGRAGNQYRPASMTTVMLANGQAVLRVDFSAPSPFGVFGTPSTR